MEPSGRYFEVVVFASDGKPASWAPQNLIMVLDLDFMPAFEHRPMIITSGYGLVRMPAPDGPFAICMPLAVDGFGHVYLYADNEGKGYAADEVSGRRLNLSVEFATSRLAAVRRHRCGSHPVRVPLQGPRLTLVLTISCSRWRWAARQLPVPWPGLGGKSPLPTQSLTHPPLPTDAFRNNIPVVTVHGASRLTWEVPGHAHHRSSERSPHTQDQPEAG